MHAADVARLALEGIRQDDGQDAEFFRLLRRRLQRDAGGGDHVDLVAGKDRVGRIRRAGHFGFQMGHHGGGELHPIFGDDRQRLRG